MEIINYINCNSVSYFEKHNAKLYSILTDILARANMKLSGLLKMWHWTSFKSARIKDVRFRTKSIKSLCIILEKDDEDKIFYCFEWNDEIYIKEEKEVL